jgi:hypothetical protein
MLKRLPGQGRPLLRGAEDYPSHPRDSFANQRQSIHGRTLGQPDSAGVAELVDAPDLGSGAARRGGSSPFTRTNFLCQIIEIKRLYVFMGK